MGVTPESTPTSVSHQGHMSQDAGNGLYCTAMGSAQGSGMGYMTTAACSTGNMGDHQAQQNHMAQQVLHCVQVKFISRAHLTQY